MALQRFTWRIERACWVALSIIIILALFGLFGNGPLSSTSTTGASGRLEVDYGRFQRSGTTHQLKLRIDGAAPGDFRLRFGPSFLEAFRIEHIAPQPKQASSGADGMQMLFAASDGTEANIYLSLRAEKIGTAKIEVGLVGETPVRITQFIFP